ncbi:MAG: hypothetical protein E6H81_15570 [Chloroflexi bacterium]|nr:MAG: hypothetical protein E6H81_15570 [Chloroflexota bacterium]
MVQLALEILVTVQAQLGVVGEVGAELEEEGAEVPIDGIDIVKVSSGMRCVRAKRSSAAIKALVIGSISAEEANVAPRWARKKCATPSGVCRCGTYTLRYIRSILSMSNVTF